jgi:Domain of unknown function (DUF1814).
VTEHGYADPAALRQAINERLRALVREDSRLQLADLQRQFAYDRFLTRVFLAVDRDRWVLKGAAALLARLHGRTRHTVDVDLYREESGPEEAEAALRDAAARDLGDFFRFTLSPGRPVAQAGAARRVPVVAYLGATEFASFHVDLVTGIAMTGEPDEVPSLVPIELSGLETVRYRIYPIADHVADKVCALLELHPRAAGPSQVSTRYRDLADLAVIAHAEVVAAEDLRVALASEANRRGLSLPATLPTPTIGAWRSGYARVARDVPSLAERDLEVALSTVRAFLDPVFEGTAAGVWDPATMRWSDR